MTWEVEIEHVAGILSGAATVEPGLNAVRASNWQGKSSFVAAIETALGTATPLTEGKDRGRVHAETPGGEVAVDLVRENGEVRRRGEPYLTDEYDATRADLFACLDETNDIRHAVRTGGNLAEPLLRPLEVQNIDNRIADLQHEREQVESELAKAREATDRLPAVRERVGRLETELADLRERRETLAGETDSTAVASSRRELAGARSERERAADQVDRLENDIERIEAQLREKRAALAEVDAGDPGDVESDLADARADLEEVRRDVEVLQSVYSATEMILEEGKLDLLTDVERGLCGDTLVCWTCGSETDRADVRARLEALGDRIASRREEVETRREEVEALEARREEIEETRRRRRNLETEVSDLEEQLADKRQRLAETRERRDRARKRVEELAEAVDESVERLADVESDIRYREAELTEARDERDSLEQRAERVGTLSTRREGLRDEIRELRNRRDEIRFEAREAFDTALADVFERFDAGFETARLSPEFDLVVVREGHEADLDALSEGELELLGFVAALAGYEAFDVADATPVMLVDGVGGLAETNLHTLVESLRERTEYLVFTAYPEHSAVDGHEIDPAAWTIASDGVTTAE